jgi:hypothetical protein
VENFQFFSSKTKMRTCCGHEEQKKNAKSFIQNDLAFQKSTQSRG